MSDPTPGLHPDTLAVTTGRPARVVDAPLNQPPVLASTYVGTAEVGQGEVGYGRYGNPTWSALEEAIGVLEGGRALTFSSGMAAVHAVLDLVPTGGTVVIPANCYLGVAADVDERARRDGTTVRRVEISDTAAVRQAADGADLVWLESPTNPTIEVADLPALGAALAEHTILVVDNTFATPLLQRPLASGAHVVVHSGTKFLGGHSDALLGAVVVALDRYRAVRSAAGGPLAPRAVPGTLEAYLVLRGIRTLPLRLERACANAEALAARLSAHPAVRRVRYPGLPGDPGHVTAARTMSGFGSLIAIELADADHADALIAGLRLWVFATSLGGVESTLERRRRWPSELATVPQGLVRLSVGVEHVDDLWADLEQALATLP